MPPVYSGGQVAASWGACSDLSQRPSRAAQIGSSNETMRKPIGPKGSKNAAAIPTPSQFCNSIGEGRRRCDPFPKRRLVSFQRLR